MAKEIITLGGITKFFQDDLNCISKGELKFKADFVLQLQVVDYSVNAKVRASMKDKSYSVTLRVDGEGGISGGKCECPRGNWLCSHMAACAIYANKKGLSKTDLPNSWIAKPKKAAKQDSKSYAEYFPEPRPEFKAISRPVNDSDREFVHLSLAETALCVPFQWIVGPEPTPLTKDPRAPFLIEDIVEDFVENRESFKAKCKVTDEQILWLAERTTEQRRSQIWGQYRRLRLTGSNFGEVIRASERNTQQNRPFPQSLFKKLRGEYSLGTKDSIMWGQMHEEVAVKNYIDVTGHEVKPAGLYLFPCGFLGCSPDGIVTKSNNSKGILEIKCPWKYRNETIEKILEVELKDKDQKDSFYLTKDKKLHEKHNYWFQVQAEMAATGVEWAHFVIWTTKGIEIIEVEREINWQERYIPILTDFYLNKLMPTCYTKEDDI